MIKTNCDVCNSGKDVQCEIFLEGDDIERVYHLCPTCLVDIYRGCLEDFLEGNEYKVNNYIKTVIDSRIVHTKTVKKLEKSMDIDKDYKPDYIRRTKPYSDKEDSDE